MLVYPSAIKITLTNLTKVAKPGDLATSFDDIFAFLQNKCNKPLDPIDRLVSLRPGVIVDGLVVDVLWLLAVVLVCTLHKEIVKQYLMKS